MSDSLDSTSVSFLGFLLIQQASFFFIFFLIPFLILFLIQDLGSKDMLREKIFFICQVIRIGGMDQRESGDTMQRAKSIHSSKKFSDGIRRPFGVVAMDITEVITERTMYDLDHQFQVPFLPCEEKDSIESIVKKFVNMKMGDTLTTKFKDQGLWVSMKMLHGNVKQLDGGKCYR